MLIQAKLAMCVDVELAGYTPGVSPRLVFWSKYTPVAKIGKVALWTWMLDQVTLVILPFALRDDLKRAKVSGVSTRGADLLAYNASIDVMLLNRTLLTPVAAEMEAP